jgi:hypothetical protein
MAFSYHLAIIGALKGNPVNARERSTVVESLHAIVCPLARASLIDFLLGKVGKVENYFSFTLFILIYLNF